MGAKSGMESRVEERREVLSGPPLSIGRLRHNSARDPGVTWRGVGLTALVARLGLASDSSPRYVRAEDIDALTAPAAVRDLFAAGGTEAVLVDESGAPEYGIPAESARDSGDEEPARSGWAGEDGGPGRRTGLYQLLDLQDVSVIALAELSTRARRDEVLRLARSRPDKLFVLAEGGEGPAIERATDNVLLVRGSGDTGGFAGELGTGPLVGLVCALLRSRDFDGGLTRRVRLTPAESAVLERLRGTEAWCWAEAWRRREGLRRSIELGTRWVVLEHHRPLVWRRVEREVRGFLFRMADLGLVRPPRRTPFVVQCVAEEGASARVAVRVRVRLTDPWHAALTVMARVDRSSADDAELRVEAAVPAADSEPLELDGEPLPRNPDDSREQGEPRRHGDVPSGDVPSGDVPSGDVAAGGSADGGGEDSEATGDEREEDP